LRRLSQHVSARMREDWRSGCSSSRRSAIAAARVGGNLAALRREFKQLPWPQ
jgi:hypothetical protein